MLFITIELKMFRLCAVQLCTKWNHNTGKRHMVGCPNNRLTTVLFSTWGPDRPISPISPFCPLRPRIPGGPISPETPVSPWSPWWVKKELESLRNHVIFCYMKHYVDYWVCAPLIKENICYYKVKMHNKTSVCHVD
jgi:hypothetical protein